MNGTLTGKTAIVTGAGRGLGNGIATELAKAGAQIAVLEIDGESAQAAADDIRALGVEARAYVVDVSDSSQVNDAFSAVARDFGSIEIAVNNAGISRVGPSTIDCTDGDWLDSLAVMQTGVFYCMRAAGRHMVPRKTGSVINIASIRGLLTEPRPHQLLRSQGGRDHDDPRRRRRVGTARSTHQRDRAGLPSNTDVGYRRRPR